MTWPEGCHGQSDRQSQREHRLAVQAQVGMKVDSDWLVAIQNIEHEGDEHDREPKPGHNQL